MPTEPQHGISFRSAAVLICALVSLAYCNTFDAAWHLDDFPNITDNPAIRIDELSWDSLAGPFTRALSEGRLDRPLPRLTFALNWLAGRDAPEGYHLVNVVIHVLNAWLLFLTARAVFRTPNLRGVPRRDADFICLLGVVLWALNPIQTQAVTYIVQRMASMAALFCTLGLYSYVRARLSGSARACCGWALACTGAFALGLASKENAAVLPLTLFACELCFFQDLRDRGSRRRMAVAGGAGVVVLLAVGSLAFLHGDPLAVFSYGNRYFTPWERLLTQARVLVFYLSLLFYPAPTRLSIEHDFAVSTSLIHPWTTLAAAALLGGLLALALWQVRKRPLLAFGILFFFVNHLVESTVIGLELVFEHRNYLASMFVFFPVAAGLRSLMNRYDVPPSRMRWVLGGFVTLLIVGFGASTYVRNQVWSSGQLLWEDAVAKAPESSRPLHNLAWDHYERIGDYRTALETYAAALRRTKTNIYQECIILNNMASIFYTAGDYPRATEHWQRALASYAGYPEIRYRLALSLARQGDLDGAEAQLEPLLAQAPAHAHAANLKGVLLLKRGRPEEAIRWFQEPLKSAATRAAATINIGAAWMASGDSARARWFFKEAVIRYPGEKVGLLWLSLVETRSGERDLAAAHMRRLVESVRVPDLLRWMPEGDALGLLRDTVLLPGRDPAVLGILATCLRSLQVPAPDVDLRPVETGLPRPPLG